MDAGTAIEIAVYGAVIPAVAALLVFAVIGWLWPAEIARRYRCGLAFALAVFLGYVALPSTVSLAPAQFWEWLPHLAVLAAFVAGLTRARGVTRGERWAAIYLFAAVAAWLIVPQWPDLGPAWPIQWGILALAIVTFTALVQPLALAIPGRGFPWWLMLAAATTSVLIMDQVSETFGRLAALPAGALLGCGLAARFSYEAADWRGLVLPYAVVVGGFAYTGGIYPTPPLWPLVLVPLAPLALWICTWGRLARFTGVRAVAIQAVCVLTPLVILAALLLARGNGTDGDW